MLGFSQVSIKCQWIFFQGEWEAAIALFAEAIKLNPNSAAMFAKRGWVLIPTLSCFDFCNFRFTISGRASSRFRNQMHASGIAPGEKLKIGTILNGKHSLNLTRAIELNPDNAGAYKFRGRAHRLLGNFTQVSYCLLHTVTSFFSTGCNRLGYCVQD